MYTKLDIINAMVGSTGARTFTAQQTNHPTYTKAERLLDRVQKAVQSIGLWFNTEVREIAQQVNGELLVPLGCIKADPVDRNHNLTLRGSRMYNLDTGNYTIGRDLKLKMIFEVPLEDMPLSAQEYIRARAVYEFYLDQDGADPKLSNYRNEQSVGWSMMYREHLRNKQENIFDNPSNIVAQLRRGYSARYRPTEK